MKACKFEFGRRRRFGTESGPICQALAAANFSKPRQLNYIAKHRRPSRGSCSRLPKCIVRIRIPDTRSRAVQRPYTAGNRKRRLMATPARHRSVATPHATGTLTLPRSAGRASVKIFVAAEAEPQQEALARLLRKSSAVEVIGKDSRIPFDHAAMS